MDSEGSAEADQILLEDELTETLRVSTIMLKKLL